MFHNKTIFITGWTGSWWQELITQLLPQEPKEIIVYSRWEHRQVEMKRRFYGSKNIRYIIGDVRDKERLVSVTKGVDIIFHLAALKHVPICEDNPYESVQTNIIGTQNVVDAAMINSVSRVIDVSTDKAVDPFNIYGTCKAVGEKLIIAANAQTDKTDFVCVRWGNVLWTNWSVVPLFIEQIKKANTVTLTDGTMTRFIMSLRQAIWLLITASVEAKWGEVIVMNMPGVTVDTIANTMIRAYGDPQTIKTTIGSRPGEKKHELLVSQYESERTHLLGEKYFVILPMIDTGRDYSTYLKLPKFPHVFFGSDNTELLNVDEFFDVLVQDGWINMQIDSQESLQELHSLSKEELISYFQSQWWIKR